MIRRIRCMLIKEFLQVLRDPRMGNVVFVAPVLQMLIFAFALTTDVTNIRTMVLDQDRTPTSRELIAEFAAAGYFHVESWADTPNDLATSLDAGTIRAALHLPAGFEADMSAGRSPAVQLLVDGTDSNTASIVLTYANQITAAYAARKQAARLAEAGRPAPAPAEIVVRPWYNPNLESRFYFVPRLIAIMLLMISVLLASIAIVREKEIGTIEQVLVTPITAFEFILGKTVPYLLMGYIIMTLMLGLARLVFGVHVQGSYLLLYGLTGIYLVGNLGLALFISVSAHTQQQALLTAFLFLMPSILLSGFMFPISNMPVAVQYLTWLDPLRWFLVIVGGVVQKGVGLEALWPEVLGESALAAGFLVLAAVSFRKTLG